MLFMPYIRWLTFSLFCRDEDRLWNDSNSSADNANVGLGCSGCCVEEDWVDIYALQWGGAATCWEGDPGLTFLRVKRTCGGVDVSPKTKQLWWRGNPSTPLAISSKPVWKLGQDMGIQILHSTVYDLIRSAVSLLLPLFGPFSVICYGVRVSGAEWNSALVSLQPAWMVTLIKLLWNLVCLLFLAREKGNHDISFWYLVCIFGLGFGSFHRVYPLGFCAVSHGWTNFFSTAVAAMISVLCSLYHDTPGLDGICWAVVLTNLL